MKLWPALSRPIIFAHRGASAHAPENTLAAFQQACEEGAQAIEFDVKLSADGEVVIIHDATVDRTTNGEGRVNRLPLGMLRELDAGSWFGKKFRGVKIPTLEEACAAFGRKLYMNIELTNYASPCDSLVERVAGLITRHALADRVLFSSFLASNLRKAERLIPEVPRALLVPRFLCWMARRIGWREGRYQAIHFAFEGILPEWVEKMHSRDLWVHAWTVNGESIVRRLLGWGVDGIITDDPRMALRCSRSLQ